MKLTHYTGHLWALEADGDAGDFIFVNCRDGVYSFSANMLKKIPPPTRSSVMGEAWKDAIAANSNSIKPLDS
jgi:hypothetical protein